jgi:hypothetical protein
MTKGEGEMASRSRTTFKKRQKEIARMEKQRDKAAKRMQRKAEKLAGHVEPDQEVASDEVASEEMTPEAEPPESIKTADTTTL